MSLMSMCRILVHALSTPSSIIHPAVLTTTKHTCPVPPLQCLFPFQQHNTIEIPFTPICKSNRIKSNSHLFRVSQDPTREYSPSGDASYTLSRASPPLLRSCHPPSPRARLYRRRRTRLTSTSYTQTYIGFTTSMSQAPFKCKYQVSLSIPPPVSPSHIQSLPSRLVPDSST